MNQTVTGEELGLDMSTIMLMMPGLTDMSIITEPLLPPVALPQETDTDDEWDYVLQLGDVFVTIYSGEDVYMSLYVSTEAPMALSAAADGTSIGLELGEPTVMVDVVSTSSDYSVTIDDTETLFADLMPLYLPEITGAVGEVTLPSIGGFSIGDISTSMAGSDPVPGFFLLSGELE